MPEEETKKKRGLSGLFDHFNDLLDVVADLQEGQELNRSGEIKSRSGKVSGLYGLHIRSGLEGEGGGPVFEHFGDMGNRGNRGSRDGSEGSEGREGREGRNGRESRTRLTTSASLL